MIWLIDFWRSSIGGKATMAVTGLCLFGFVVAHLLGNLQFLGAPALINDYARFLHGKPALLWLARCGLLAVFVLHVVTGVRLARANRAARPVPYAKDTTVQATFASRSMVLTGLTTLVFLVYHLLHFTLGVVHAGDYARGIGIDQDLHATMALSFGHPGIVLVYALGQVVLFLHLAHGIQSLAQTLGLHHARYTPMIRVVSWAIAAAIAAGNLLIATAVLSGIVGVAS